MRNPAQALIRRLARAMNTAEALWADYQWTRSAEHLTAYVRGLRRCQRLQSAIHSLLLL